MNKSFTAQSLFPLVALCLVCDIVLPQAKADGISASVQIPVIILSTILSAILVVLINSDISINSWHKTAKVFIGIGFVAFACENFLRMQSFYSFVNSEALPFFVLLLLTLSIFLVAFFAHKGAIQRSAAIIVWLFLFSLILLVGANIGNMRTNNLYSSVFDANVILKAFAFGFRFAPELIIIPLFSSSNKSVKLKFTLAALFGSMLIAIILIMSKELVLGKSALKTETYMHVLARLGGISVFKRLDAVHSFVWILTAFVKQSTFFVLAARLFSKKSTNKYIVYAVVCVAFALCCAIFNLLETAKLTGLMNIGSFLIVLACIAISRVKGKTLCEKNN